MNAAKRPSYRPILEPLETREVPTTANFSSGVLTVLGGDGNNNIAVGQINGLIKVVDGPTLIGQYQASSVAFIVVAAEGGNDQVRVGNEITKTAYIYGGWGNDVLYGGSGNDQLFGGSGTDYLFGRAGNDMLVGGAGSDSLDGGAGTNTLNQNTLNLTYQMATVELAVVNLVNQERANAGLPALTASPLLAKAAKIHSTWMAYYSRTRGSAAMQHTLYGSIVPTPGTRLDYVGYDNWQTYGENIAYGYQTAAQVVQAWMNSPGHRANILNPNFRQIGVGMVANTQGIPYWTQVFGTSF